MVVLAGEESGDLHGAAVVEALSRRAPDLRFWGLGGHRLRAAGVECVAGLDDLAVMGFAEVVSRLRFFRRLERRVRARMDEGDVDLVLAVDYPGFNLRAVRYAHAQGIPVLYYIAPQVWAWKAGRAARLARDADTIAVILPFEVEIFEREGAHVEFVGHPLLDIAPRGSDRIDALEPHGDPDGNASGAAAHAAPDRNAFLSSAGLDPERPVLALFPGSRRQEIRRHLGPFLSAAARLRSHDPSAQVAVARAPSLAALDLPDDVCVVDDGRALLRHARAGIVKSGTSTLEAALAGLPFVCAYRTHPLTFALAKRIVRVDHVALANLVAGARVVPEVLQGDATGPGLFRELAPLWDETDARARVQAGLATVRERLGVPGAAERVAELALRLLQAPAT